MNIRQPEITSRIAISQPFMIKSQLVQNGGMQVMDTGWLFDRFETKVIRCAISHAPSNPPPPPRARTPYVFQNLE